MTWNDDHALKPIVVDGKVTNHEQLKRYYQDRYERNCRIQRSAFNDWRDERGASLVAKEPQEIIHRHIHYNSDVSLKQWSRIDAISGELKYLREKLAEKEKPRQRPQPKTQPRIYEFEKA